MKVPHTMSFKFDWIDGLLTSIYFMIGIFLSHDYPYTIKYLPTAVIILYIIRRYVFQTSSLAPSKTELIWRLSSLLGLILTTGSIVCFIIAWAFIKDTQDVPDFRLEAEKRENQIQSSFRSLNDEQDIVVVAPYAIAEEIPEILKQRELGQQNKPGLSGRREQRIVRRARQLEKKFKAKNARRYDEGIKILKWAITLCLTGCILLRLRYPLRSLNN